MEQDKIENGKSLLNCTIFFIRGGPLSNVNSIHIEIRVRVVFVEVKLQKGVFASNVFCLQGAQQIEAFITPPVKKQHKKVTRKSC